MVGGLTGAGGCCQSTTLPLLQGITTDVNLLDFAGAENKHAGALVLRKGAMTETAEVC